MQEDCSLYNGVEMHVTCITKLEAAQEITDFNRSGTKYPRIRYGSENDDWGPGRGELCHDCSARAGVVLRARLVFFLSRNRHHPNSFSSRSVERIVRTMRHGRTARHSRSAGAFGDSLCDGNAPSYLSPRWKYGRMRDDGGSAPAWGCRRVLPSTYKRQYPVPFSAGANRCILCVGEVRWPNLGKR
jgi:hypothetical protein